MPWGRLTEVALTGVAVALGLSLAPTAVGTPTHPPATASASVPSDTPVDTTPVDTTPVDTTPVDTPVATVPVDPLGALGALFDDEGGLGIDAALGLFAALVAPLPGVQPAALANGAPDGAAALAIRRLANAEGELSPELWAAVDAALAVQPGEVEVVIGGDAPPGTRPAGVGRPARRPRGIPEPSGDELAASIAAIVGELERLSGHTLSIPIRARLVADSRFGGNPTGVGRRDGTGRTTHCEITLPRGMFGAGGDDPDSANSSIVHEVWHCFQYDADFDAAERAPAWMLEGQAEWAGETIVGGSPSSAERWDSWLSAPERSLLRRSYDAIGVYAVAASSGADPWKTMLPMLGQSNPAALTTLFGQGADSAMLAVGSALVRAPQVGSVWESFGPGITGVQSAPVVAVPEGEAATVRRTLGRFATMPVVLTVTAGDVVTITIAGGASAAVELPGSGRIAVAPGSSVSFCLRADGCLCPDGAPPGGGAPLPPASPGEGAAAVAAVDAGAVSLTAIKRSLDELCSESLVGVWAVPVSVVMETLTAPYGQGPACEGTMVMTFTAEGTFSAGYAAECTIATMSATGEAAFAATYTNDETTFQLADVTGGGTMTTDNGMTMDMPMAFLPAGVPVLYALDGDLLTISFVSPDGHSFTLAWTRAA